MTGGGQAGIGPTRAFAWSSAPRAKAYQYLLQACDNNFGFQSYVSKTVDFHERTASPTEVFSSMVILDLLLDHPLDAAVKSSLTRFLCQELDTSGLYYFFQDHALLPADVDCAAIGISVLLRAGAIDSRLAATTAARIAGNTNDDNVIEVYFDSSGVRRGRLDPVVCCNGLYLIHRCGQGGKARQTEDFILRVLEQEEYVGGTRYYPSGDTFLFFLARLVKEFPALQDRFLPLLQKRVLKRIGTTRRPLDLAMRIIAGHSIGLANSAEQAELAALQAEDGSWAADSFFRYGRRAQYFGSESISTAFAIRALDNLEVRKSDHGSS